MIYGVFETKRGKTYKFSIGESGYADIWEDRTVPAPGGYRIKSFYVRPTKEFKEYIREHYGVEVR